MLLLAAAHDADPGVGVVPLHCISSGVVSTLHIRDAALRQMGSHQTWSVRHASIKCCAIIIMREMSIA